jgi:hypothetical protein
MIDQTLYKKLKNEQHKPTKMHGMIFCVPKFRNGQKKNDKKNARCESLRALLPYVEWDRFVTLAGSKSTLRVTLSYLPEPNNKPGGTVDYTFIVHTFAYISTQILHYYGYTIKTTNLIFIGFLIFHIQ